MTKRKFSYFCAVLLGVSVSLPAHAAGTTQASQTSVSAQASRSMIPAQLLDGLPAVSVAPRNEVLYRYDNGIEYNGYWQNGLPHGDGKVRLQDGSIYLGELVAGKPQGVGMLQLASGDIYKGEWRDGLFSGMGIMEYASGTRYEGSWKIGMREGKGTLFFAGGSRFDGHWKADQRSGRGRMQLKTGEKYSGDYLNDQPHGHGVIVESDGSAYAGTFSRGKRHGVGDCTQPDGTSETCVYEKGKRNTSAAVVARAEPLKAKLAPKFDFSSGVSVLWEDLHTKGKGLLKDDQIRFHRREAMLETELKLECRGEDFFLLIFVRKYKGPGQYRLGGEDIVLTLDGERPLFLADGFAAQIDITSDSDTAIEGQFSAPRLHVDGDASTAGFAVRKAQFRALPADLSRIRTADIEGLSK